MSVILPTEEVHVWCARQVAAQSFRRAVLSRYLGVEPAAVQLTVGPHGKPSLGAAAPLHFNASHSGDCHWLALAHYAVGVDGQWHRPSPPDCLAIARRFFAQSELAVLQGLADDERLAAFYRLWTRKEAMVKALGRGLAYGLARLEVSVQAHGMDCLLSLNDSAKLARHWSLGSVPVKEQNVTVAVAVAHPAIQLRVFDWQSSDPHQISA